MYSLTNTVTMNTRKINETHGQGAADVVKFINRQPYGVEKCEVFNQKAFNALFEAGILKQECVGVGWPLTYFVNYKKFA